MPLLGNIDTSRDIALNLSSAGNGAKLNDFSGFDECAGKSGCVGQSSSTAQFRLEETYSEAC
jgi:hypothetical protein